MVLKSSEKNKPLKKLKLFWRYKPHRTHFSNFPGRELDSCFDFLGQKSACVDFRGQFLVCFDFDIQVLVCFDFLDPTKIFDFARRCSDIIRLVDRQFSELRWSTPHRYVSIFSTQNQYSSFFSTFSNNNF